MDNFRGFNKTLIPLKQINFLVGENSTGKSSFLSLLYLLSRPSFWFSPELSFQEEVDLGGFRDIVSAWSEDKSTFQIGVVMTKKDKSNRTEMSFSINTFNEKDGSPKLARNFQLKGNNLTTIILDKQKIKYETTKYTSSFNEELDAIEFFEAIIKSHKTNLSSLKQLPRSFPINVPLSIAHTLIQSIESGDKNPRSEFRAEIPFAMNMTWVAPIRTKPKRFYDGLTHNYSPEGEHIPLLLRKTLRSRAKGKKFEEHLSDFGKSSGLFESVTAHSFGKGNQTPFELLVKFSGAELNIKNVGYGVSQVLPLIVEFLTEERKRSFAIQQPEVHLHPKAQAALGGLLFEIAKEKGSSFYIETHSDYLIDRYRLSMRKNKTSPDSQILFFTRTPNGNKPYVIPIDNNGSYKEQPKEFRDFFIKEEIKLLGMDE